MPIADREARNRYQREWMDRRRRAWLLANGPCRLCGSWEDLEVDHVEPEQKIDHRVWSWSAARMASELAKCQPLCGNCHQGKTSDARPRPEHGTNGMYTNQKCRCGPCRAAHATANRKVEPRGGG